MIGDDLDEQRDKLIKDGVTSEKWDLEKGIILINPQNGVYTRYLREATITLEGQNIKRIFFQAEFTSYPNDVADSFLGIVKEMEEYGLPVIKPQWQMFDDKITNQYRMHNSLWDVEVNIGIRGKGTTNITLNLTANLIDNNGNIAEDSAGIYHCFSKLVRRNKQIENYLKTKDKNIIFF
jgi:hypothetical protein